MEQLTAREAARFVIDNPNALFVDCRSEREYRFVGHPVGAKHVPWNEEPGWDINPNFVADVAKLAADSKESPLVLICRDGSRAVEAGKALEASGFVRVFAVRHGFEGDVGPNFQRGGVNGWRCDGLPWELSACTGCPS